MRRRTAARHDAGMSMIEVLAAMVIFSTSAVMLFSWINQTAQRLNQLSAEQTSLFGELAALEYLRSLNPMQKPTGTVALGDTEVSWNAVPVGDEEQARTNTGARGLYSLQLYKVELTVRPPRVAPSHRSLYLAGWRQTQDAKRETPFVLEK